MGVPQLADTCLNLQEHGPLGCFLHAHLAAMCALKGVRHGLYSQADIAKVKAEGAAQAKRAAADAELYAREKQAAAIKAKLTAQVCQR